MLAPAWALLNTYNLLNPIPGGLQEARFRAGGLKNPPHRKKKQTS